MITDSEAKRIAGEWEDGGDDAALHVLTETGAISWPGAISEAAALLAYDATSDQARAELISLLVYLDDYGAGRDPVAGWEHL